MTWAQQGKDAVDPDHAAKMARGLEVFKTHVRPVLVKSCVRCHGGKDTEGEFDLSDRAGLLKGGASGPAVLLGKGRDSLLYKMIAHTKEPFMPFQGKKLSNEVLGHLAAWIDLGAPYDEPLVASRKPSSAWTQKVIAPDAKRHWAFQPLLKVQIPAVKDEGWVRTPVDRFLLAKLEAVGLKPNPVADRRLLIRRAYFDLLGLPPAPEEVEAFLADRDPDAYGRLIDRLLARPEYGERWGRHWLDLARFAESHGFEHDYDRPTAFHYRDFVIKALNADLPYDTFVKWQIAGDEFPNLQPGPEQNLALTATGFLAAGVHSTQITKNEVEKHRYDELDDKLATVGTAMLGLTIGCARCHDHKYDPVPQADYYRLLASFTATVRGEVELNTDPEGYKRAFAAFQQAHEPFAHAVRRFEREQLPGRLATWEKSWTTELARFPWVTAEGVEAKSAGGATLTQLDDGSWLASGKNPNQDTYTFTLRTRLTGITGMRVEALAHPSLVKGGPGRAKQGNFALTDLRVTAVPAGATNAKPVPVKLKNARATFEQQGLPAAAAVDGDAKSGWAVDPQFGKDHAAAFDCEVPVGFADGTIFTVTLQFKNNVEHSIGRVRLALTAAAAPPAPTAGLIREQALTALGTPAATRSAEQAAALLQWFRTQDADWQTLNQKAEAHRATAPRPQLVKALVATEGVAAVRLHTQGGDLLPETHFLRRGDPALKEGVASQAFLQVLSSSPQGAKHWQTPPPAGAKTSYQRRALAEWLTDVEHGSGALLARVIVNRLWQHHLGRGLVATPSDFGLRGEAPSHPELLDWLAGRLIDGGWRLKELHKLLMTSAAYMQGSEVDDARLAADRENRLFWRRPARRLEAEVIRDALLAVSGELDGRMFGAGTLDPASKRRSIYFTVKRSKLVPMMQVFDAPDALGGVAERPTTTVAPQALYLMNNPQVRAYARGLARRVAAASVTGPDEAIRQAYRTALSREPNGDELTESRHFLQEQTQRYQTTGVNQPAQAALVDFCQTLLCLNEFVYVD